uniref:Uncharacterized protein n=1 Tax=Cacopsylla melanoneura TaxID=428564 RepID=A0A8D8ZB36_9HEMI
MPKRKPYHSKTITTFLLHIMSHNLHLVSNITNKYSPGFLPGIISRYEPGVHEMDASELSLHLGASLRSVSPPSPGNNRNTLLRSSANPWDKLYGQTSLCATHLYATYLRVTHPGYDLTNRSFLRKIDTSYYPTILQSIAPPSPPLFNAADDHVITVTLTPAGTDYVESPGLAIYGAPGNGKSYAQSRFLYRHADTDFLYDPDKRVVNQLASLGVTIFSNQYDLLIGNVPLIMFLPSNKLMVDRILSKTDVNASVADKWVTDLEARVKDVRARADCIRRDKKCVIFVRTDRPEYIVDVISGLCNAS